MRRFLIFASICRARSRVTPKLSARLFQGGFSAVEDVTHWAKAKGILDHPAVKNLLALCAAYDKMLRGKEFEKMMNSEAGELMSRRMWGTMRAFGDVSEEADWRKPTGHQGKFERQ